MSYKLSRPYSEEEYANFIIKYNHHKGLDIKIMENAVYALEANEMIGEQGEPVINPNFEAEQAKKEAERTKQEIKSELYKLDLKTIRPLRSILTESPTDDDLAKIKEIEAKTVELRSRFRNL